MTSLNPQVPVFVDVDFYDSLNFLPSLFLTFLRLLLLYHFIS
jgi:hypothetical protein